MTAALARPLWRAAPRLGWLWISALLLTLPPAQAAWSTPLGGAVTPQLRSAAVLISSRVEDMAPRIRRAYILSIQEELVAHGYHVGPVDGANGSKTKGAIRQYQRDAGLPVDGVATKELLDHLKFALPKVYARNAEAPSAAPSKEVSEAPASDRYVRDVQYELRLRGYYQGPLDGLDGPRTRDAIRQYQEDAGLDVTGAIDSGLVAELQNADPSIQRE